MGSLNWASGLIPLDHLYLRPLQHHFHSLGLTNRFTPLRRSVPLVLANLLRHWQDLRFLTSGIPIRTFQAYFTIFTDASTQGWGAHMGIPSFRVLDPYRPQAPYQLSGAQGGSLCPTALGPSAPWPPGYDRYGQFDSSFVYQQARRDPFPHLVTFDSRASSLVRGSEHNSPREEYSRLSERDSRPPISSESANIDRVVPPPRDRETYLQVLGNTRSRHVCNSVELPPLSVHVSNSGATSPSGGCSVSGLAGEVNVHVSSIQSAQQSHSEAPVHPGGRSNSRSPLVAETVVVFHTYFVFVWITPVCFPYRRDLLSQQHQKYVLDGKSYHLHSWRLSCDTIKQQAFQTRSLGSPQPLRGPQPIACTTIGGFASLLKTQGKCLNRLIPQLLR